MEEETTLKDEIKEVNKKMDMTMEQIAELKRFNARAEELIADTEIKKNKPKKLSKSLQKKGYVNWVYIRENGNMSSLKLPIEELTIMYEKTPRLATPEHILNWDGIPTIIQPSWSIQPFSVVQSYEETVKNKLLAAGYRLVTNRMELGEVKAKGKISGMVILLIIAAVLVGGYLLLK